MTSYSLTHTVVTRSRIGLIVFEVWEYEISQYDKASMGGGLFSGYVDNFLKIKQECSGWRSWCVDDGSKEHLCEYLDIWSKIYSKIIFKFMVVQVGQRENLNQTSIISEVFENYGRSFEGGTALLLVSDDVISVNQLRPEDGVEPLTTVNVVLAAYTTANA
uniref:Uncharacterized protein n=1 Tax=Photinus pyralis TaxID=7054 RepID=A0A1Y1LCE6_PHOPY